jgi:hypothetical protein
MDLLIMLLFGGINLFKVKEKNHERPIITWNEMKAIIRM